MDQTNEAKRLDLHLKVFDIIGYAKTATLSRSQTSLFLDNNHEVIINRNKLLPMARLYIENKNFEPC